MSKVCIIEDEADIASLLEYSFQTAGYATSVHETGEAGLEYLSANGSDLVILDVMLPGMSGTDVLRQMRKDPALAEVPVIMLTARGEEVDRVVGLELGADDYVVKPFSMRELLLRVKGLLGRRGSSGVQGESLRSGDLSMDFASHRVFLGETEIELTATEFKLLAELMRHKGQALDRDRLLSSVWGYSFDGYARTVDTHMRRLRAKLGAAAERIETLRGVGYRFTG